ncbi:MAG: hypothetical protein M3T55_08220 [Pseudomonadota bacterium]|nr:hypothetical protein [Pseudomonadota bacterium]
MRGFKNVLKTGALGAVAAIGVLATTATSASAYIACNRFHQCWHVRTRYAYPARVGINVYPNTWRWNGSGYRWVHDRNDRGYWNNGGWRRF